MSNYKLILEFEASKTDLTYVQWLEQELQRLRKGDWTKEEIHNLCHDLPKTVSHEEFAQGCHKEQKKLYNCVTDRELVIKAVKIFTLQIKEYPNIRIEEISEWLHAAETRNEI